MKDTYIEKYKVQEGRQAFYRYILRGTTQINKKCVVLNPYSFCEKLGIRHFVYFDKSFHIFTKGRKKGKCRENAIYRYVTCMLEMTMIGRNSQKQWQLEKETSISSRLSIASSSNLQNELPDS